MSRYKYGTTLKELGVFDILPKGTRVAITHETDALYFIRRIGAPKDTDWIVNRRDVKLDSHTKKPWYSEIVNTPLVLTAHDRALFSAEDGRVVEVSPTYAVGGDVDPVSADILHEVLAAYVQSNAYKEDWKRIAREHFKK
jgi:hypothetical protein